MTKHCGFFYIPSSLIHRSLCVDVLLLSIVVFLLCFAMLLPRHQYPQSILPRFPLAARGALLCGYLFNLRISAHLCSAVVWSHVSFHYLVSKPQRTVSLCHSCSINCSSASSPETIPRSLQIAITTLLS